MSTKYHNQLQRKMVIKGVRALLSISLDQPGGSIMSQETLALIVREYSDLVDSPGRPGPDKRYGPKQDDDEYDDKDHRP